MSTILIASLQPGQGRTAIAAGLGARLAAEGRAVRLMRLRSNDDADPAARDDAQALASVPGCEAERSAASEQEALSATQGDARTLHLVESPAGVPNELVTVPGGGHGGFTIEENIRIYRAIRNFLSAHDLTETSN